MKTRFLLPAAAVAFCVVAMALAGDGPPRAQSSDPAIAKLQLQVCELRRQVERLEKRVRDLESGGRFAPSPRPLPGPLEPAPFEKPRHQAPGLQPPFAPGERPEIWGERHVNGWTYYLIPCAQKAGGQTRLNPSP